MYVCMCSSYLPLSHIAAQLIDIHCLQALGGTTYFAQPDALKVRMSLSYSTLTQPTLPLPSPPHSFTGLPDHDPAGGAAHDFLRSAESVGEDSGAANLTLCARRTMCDSLVE